MKKIVNIIMIAGAMAVMTPLAAIPVDSAKVEVVDSSAATKDSNAVVLAPVVAEKEEGGLHQVIKEKISEGGIEFMSIVLVCLIIGLIIAVERVITLTLSTSNTKKLMNDVGDALANGGVTSALEICRSTKGPVATIFTEGLDAIAQGRNAVKDAVENYGGSEIGKLEKGLPWISLFIALAPMFGFMGTVIGMIDAFDTIESAEEIQIAQVAGGIKTALLTTVAGLIVAVILQIFYNYLVSTIDAISGKMEDASNDFTKLLDKKGIYNK